MDFLALIEGFQKLFIEFSAGWYIGLSAACYLIIQVLRGKAGFRIPWVTNLWNKIKSKTVKNGILLGLFAVAGGLVTLQSKDCNVWIFLNGMLSGIAFGMGTMGVRHASKAAMESDTAQALKTKVLSIMKKSK